MRVRKKFSIKAVINLYAKKGTRAKLNVKKLDKNTVLIEGNASSLEFLGQVLLAHAQAHDCGFELSPKGPGSSWFEKTATLGFYFHRLPCTNKRVPGHASR